MKRNLFYVAAFAFTLLSCSQEDLTNKSAKDGSKQGTPFVGTFSDVLSENLGSRTSVNYDRTARTVTYNWEPGDKIWLDDGNNAEAEIATSVGTATFFLSGGYNAQNYTVYYPGKNATSYNTVTIKSAQSQAVGNNSSHFGESGDCGIAIANKKPSGGYTFSLSHKASYLCFLPRIAGCTETGWVLTSIKVTSNNNIAGDYTLSTAGLSGSGSSNEITLTVSNFDITNPETDQARNASYIVIAPGTHTLKVEYTIKNTITGVTNVIEKMVGSKNYLPNTLYPITANMFTDYSNTKYYQWDAEKDYWYGKTAVDYATGLYSINDVAAATINGDRHTTSAEAYRWWNNHAPEIPGFTMEHGYGNKFYYATRSGKDCPNVFELAWYYDKGDVRWDATEPFHFRGRVYHGGVWIKKQSVIAQENGITVDALKNTYPGDHSNQEYMLVHPDANNGLGPKKAIGQGKPAASVLKNYFFVPALGYYGSDLNEGSMPYPTFNELRGLGTRGVYTCSNIYDLYNGTYVWAFEFDATNIWLHSTAAPTSAYPLWKAQ